MYRSTYLNLICYYHTTVDTPAVFLIATAERIVQLQPFDDDGSDGWRDTLPDLDISGATVLDVDVMENRIYWINKAEKVSTVLSNDPLLFMSLGYLFYL